MAQQDSTKNLTLTELKQTVKLLTELEKRRGQLEVFMDKEDVYKNIIQGYQAGEELRKQQQENLRAQIEAVKPAWYDHFWTGAAVAGIIISSIFFLSK